MSLFMSTMSCLMAHCSHPFRSTCLPLLDDRNIGSRIDEFDRLEPSWSNWVSPCAHLLRFQAEPNFRDRWPPHQLHQRYTTLDPLYLWH